MKVPLFNEPEIARIRRAYIAGVPTYELSTRFGIGESLILDVARGRESPKVIAVGPAISNVEEIKAERKRRIEACRLHFRDLVAAYRPDVIEKHNSILMERKRRRRTVKKPPVDSNDNKPSEKLTKQLALSPTVTRRSIRIFSAGLDHFGMTEAEMTGKTRTDEYVKARHTLMFVIYSECSRTESTPSIGRMFNKDHSTVVTAVHKIRKLLAQGDKDISAHVAILREVV